MTENEFFRQQQAAVERMKEMNARAQIPNNNRAHKMPPVPSFVKMPESNRRDRNFSGSTNQQRDSGGFMPEVTTEPIGNATSEEPINKAHKVNQNKTLSSKSGLNIPFLDNILQDSDSTLILGLMLILMSENTDKMLLFALVYILL